MVAHSARSYLTLDAYLALEERSQIKHEYVRGLIQAMSGGTIAHDLIANNLRAAIGDHLDDGPCRVLGPDVRLRVGADIYYYPDALVVCDEDLDLDAVEVRSARLIVEVLSDSTEGGDRGEKFANYQTLEGVQEYVLVGSRRRSVERFRRAERGLWVYERHDPDGAVTLESLGLTLPVAACYRRTPL